MQPPPRQQLFRFPTYWQFFSITFVYSLMVAILFQKIALPMVPDMHAGMGLLKNDATTFHNAAVELAKRIQLNGWLEWSIYTQNHTGNVSLLSIVYTIFGPNPVFFLPITAILHALSGTIVYRIGFKLTKNNIGKLAGLIAGICFITFPSTLLWYAQNHKDSFSIAGFLILVETWLTITSLNCKNITVQEFAKYIFASVMGITLIGIVRPHMVFIVSLGFISSYSIVISMLFFARSLSWQHTLRTTIFVATFLGVGIGFTHIGTSEKIYNSSEALLKDFHWQSSTYLPDNIDKKIKRIAELRAYFANYNLSVGASSDIDDDRLPDSTNEAIKYMPRALIIALFAPFPNSWNIAKAPRLVSTVETCVWYIFFAGMLISFKKYANIEIIACIALCLPIMAIIAFVNPNVGTLYRERYGFWQIFLLIGAIGWVTLLTPLFRSTREVTDSNNTQIINKL